MSASDFELFRKNLKNTRSASGITGSELSNALGFARQKRIADIEEGKGRPSLEEVSKICKHFNVSIDDMLYRTAQVTIEFI